MIDWLVERLTPREGWDTFLLLLVLVLCLPAAAIAAEWVPGDEGLLPLAVFGLLVGRWLAFREEWGGAVWLPVGASVGLLSALGVASQAVPFLPGSGESAFDFARRWVVWLEAAFSGGTSEDPDVFLFYAALLCWAAVLLSAWAFHRHRRPLLTLLPIAILSAVTVFYSGEGILWLVAVVGCSVLVLAVGNLTRGQRTWDATGVDYASGLSIEVLAVAFVVAIPVILISMVGPLLTARQISDWYHRTFEEPRTQVEDAAERLFGGVSPPEGPDSEGGMGSGGGASSYLPQSRLLGGRPDLLDEVVMMVWTDEPPPPPEDLPYEMAERYESPRHYWRGTTVDQYSGRGWSTTVEAREEVEGELPLVPPPAYREVEQRYQFTAPHGDTLYALNVPIWVDTPVEVRWRIPLAASPSDGEGGDPRLSPLDSEGGDPGLSPSDGEGGDLAALASEVMSYTVISRLPTPTADDLRAIPPLYPSQILDVYLQLPETVPQRVIDLAQDVVAGGETVYERARLLERYLRAYPYSLDVDRPPEDRDVADYFLFEMREGYCDYYATAFVVMARAVGIPTRMASGFVGGYYDRGSGAYLVSQRNGHSWPEVYFPGWGWIGFEPTASQVVTEFPDELALPQGTVPEPAGPPARVIRRRLRLGGLGVVVLIGLGLAGQAWLKRLRRRAAQIVTLPLVWDWVGRGAARMGYSPDRALTPREYAASLAVDLRGRAQRTRRWNARWMDLAAQGGAEVERLAMLYSVQVYGGPQAVVMDEASARSVWTRLRRPLRRFRWLGWVQRIGERVGRESPSFRGRAD